MSFTDVINQTYLSPDLATPQDSFDPQDLGGTDVANTQQPYDAAQANRVLELLREIGRADDPALADSINAELAELGISEPMGGTTPQIVAQLIGLDDPANATQASVEQEFDGRDVELPQNFWNVGLDQNWQVLDRIVEENSQQPQTSTTI